MRVKGIYFINCAPIVSKLIVVLKTIVKPKIFERVIATIHNSNFM